MGRYRFTRMRAGRGTPRCLQGRRPVRSSHIRRGMRAIRYFSATHGARRAALWGVRRDLDSRVRSAHRAGGFPARAEGKRWTRPRRNARAAHPGMPHTQAEVVDPVDFDEEDLGIYARQEAGAGECGPALVDFRDYRDNYGWASASPGMSGAGFPGEAVSPTWLSKWISQYRPTCRRDDIPEERAAKESTRDPYAANEEHRFQIAHSPKTIGNWV